MDRNEWKRLWMQEERETFTGWDFSRLNGRMEEQALPWDYKAAVCSAITDETVVLDMGTGGGEFLLSLSPPAGRTYATEAYPPNVEISSRKLAPYGIEVRQVWDDGNLPFADGMFDLVINRHEAFSAAEVCRILKPGGLFITQQVGGLNNRELARYLLGRDSGTVDSGFHLRESAAELNRSGFTVEEGLEHYPVVSFHDVGALVYFAKIIEWEFPGFSVEACFDKLCLLQERLEAGGRIESMEHRFFITARKKD